MGAATQLTQAGKHRHHRTAQMCEQVAAMVFAGEPQQSIARTLGVSIHVLRKYYAHELETGRARVVTEVAGLILEKARQGDVHAMKFILACRAGWRETTRHELIAADSADASGAGGAPAIELVIVKSEREEADGGNRPSETDQRQIYSNGKRRVLEGEFASSDELDEGEEPARAPHDDARSPDRPEHYPDPGDLSEIPDFLR